jgi:hypothetical protein
MWLDRPQNNDVFRAEKNLMPLPGFECQNVQLVAVTTENNAHQAASYSVLLACLVKQVVSVWAEIKWLSTGAIGTLS